MVKTPSVPPTKQNKHTINMNYSPHSLQSVIFVYFFLHHSPSSVVYSHHYSWCIVIQTFKCRYSVKFKSHFTSDLPIVVPVYNPYISDNSLNACIVVHIDHANPFHITNLKATICICCQNNLTITITHKRWQFMPLPLNWITIHFTYHFDHYFNPCKSASV